MARSDPDLFREGPGVAILVAAEQPSNSKPNQCWAATDRRIIQPALISTVHPLGRTIALWAHRRPATGMAPNDDATTPTFDALHSDTAEMRQQYISHRPFKITFPK